MDLDAAAMRDTERKRLRSLVTADMDTADALHAADYELITPRGYAMSKHDYLAGSRRGGFATWYSSLEIAIRGGGDVALLRYQARISITEDDRADAAAMTCWHTDYYERRDARWQAVWSQATVIGPE